MEGKGIGSRLQMIDFHSPVSGADFFAPSNSFTVLTAAE